MAKPHDPENFIPRIKVTNYLLCTLEPEKYWVRNFLARNGRVSIHSGKSLESRYLLVDHNAEQTEKIHQIDPTEFHTVIIDIKLDFKKTVEVLLNLLKRNLAVDLLHQNHEYMVCALDYPD